MYFVVLGGVTITYLALVKLVNVRLMRNVLAEAPAEDRMSTDSEIQKFVQRHHGFVPFDFGLI